MRVLTWNLWWRFGDWQSRRKAILAVLTDVGADICVLQEVWADIEENLAGWLGGELALNWVWSPTTRQDVWQRRIDGNPYIHCGVAILSRWPIEDPHAEDLPGEPGRPALSAIIAAPHGRIPVVTGHLSSGAGRSEVRCTQVERLVRIAAERRTPDHPPIIAGDFNAWPASDEIRLLAGGLTRAVVPGLTLVDAWDFAEPGTPGYTWDRRNPQVSRGPEPNGRIDYITVGLDYGLTVGRVRTARLAAAAPVDGVWPSDHAAVVAELSEV